MRGGFSQLPHEQKAKAPFCKVATESQSVTKQENQGSEICKLLPWAQTHREKGRKISKEEGRKVNSLTRCRLQCLGIFKAIKGRYSPMYPFDWNIWKPAICKARLASHRPIAPITTYFWLLCLWCSDCFHALIPYNGLGAFSFVGNLSRLSQIQQPQHLDTSGFSSWHASLGSVALTAACGNSLLIQLFSAGHMGHAMPLTFTLQC